MALTIEQQENAIHCLELLLSKLIRDEMPDYYEITYCKKQLRKFKGYEIKDDLRYNQKV
jgi:hypothetical protein